MRTFHEILNIFSVCNSQKILNLIQPFVEQGKILPRTEAQIAANIDDYILLFEGDELLACAGLKNCQEGGMGEIYALVVSKKVQNQGFSRKLLDKLMQKAAANNFSKVFALSKHNAQWFLKQGFIKMEVNELPKKRQALFDYQRNSSIFFKRVVQDEN